MLQVTKSAPIKLCCASASFLGVIYTQEWWGKRKGGGGVKGATVKGATLGMLQWLVDLAEPIAPRCEMSIMRGKRL